MGERTARGRTAGGQSGRRVWAVALVIAMLGLSTFSTERPAEAAVTQLATVSLDAAGGPVWQAVEYTPTAAGTHTFAVARSNPSAITGAAIRRSADNQWLASVPEGAGPDQILTVELDVGEAVRIGLWITGGSTDLAVSVDSPSNGETFMISSGVRDASGDTGPRWAQTTWTAPRSGVVDFTLAWSGSGSLRFVLRDHATGTWLDDMPFGAPSPQTITWDVVAGVTYRLPVWATSGAGDHSLAATYRTGGPGPQPGAPSRDAHTGRVDASGASGPATVSVPFTVADAGRIWASLQYLQSAGELHLRLRDAGGIVLESTLTNWVAKGIETDLAAGDYSIEITAVSGAADWQLEIYVEPDRDRPSASPGAPNILVVNTDDQRADSLRHLPQIESWFVDGGVTFTNGYVTTPACCPSRASLFSGQYVHNNGVTGQRVAALDQNQTVQRYLVDAGYFTAFAGKYVHFWPQQLTAPHWDRWTYFKGGYYNTWINSDGVNRREPGNSTIRTFSQGIQYLEEFRTAEDARPWFLHLTPVTPHKPADPEPQYANAPVLDRIQTADIDEVDRSDKPPFVRNRNRTAAATESLRLDMTRTLYTYDDQVDRMMDYLQSSGELSNTLIILTSDNGYLWGEHRLDEKFVPYGPSIRVPFLVYWQGEVIPGTTDDRWVANIDIAPTVLAAAGAPIPSWMDGVDILSGADRDHAFTEYFQDPSNGGIPDWRSVRTHDWVYNEYLGADGETVEFREYYDLVADPFELTNLLADGDPANDPPLGAAQALMAQDATCAGAGCRP